MDPTTAVVVVGLAVAALLGVFAGACQLLRSDIRDLRAETRSDLQELRAESQADRHETNARFDRLEAKLDMLILALARAGFLVDPPPSPPPTDPQG